MFGKRSGVLQLRKEADFKHRQKKSWYYCVHLEIAVDAVCKNLLTLRVVLAISITLENLSKNKCISSLVIYRLYWTVFLFIVEKFMTRYLLYFTYMNSKMF